MNNIRVFVSENFHFFEVKFSMYLKWRVFVMFQYIHLGKNEECRQCTFLA